MRLESWMVLAAGLLAVLLYFVAYAQVRKVYPDRVKAIAIGAAMTNASAIAVSSLRGYGPAMWTMAPAGIMVACFIAGKGSIPVLIGSSDTEGEPSEATAQARTRLTLILVGAFIVGFVFYFIVA